MFKRRRVTVALLTALMALALLVAAAYVLLPPRQSEQVAVPAAQATPENVIRTYIRALDAHDCVTAEALVTDDMRSGAKSWCRNVAHLSRVDINRHVVEQLQDSGRSVHEEVANVPVTFDLDWRLFHNDASMDEGRTVWGFLLVRDSTSAPWRVFDQGTG